MVPGHMRTGIVSFNRGSTSATPRRDIEAAIGQCPAAFCYPAGQRSALVEAVLHSAGCTVAFTTELGHNDLRSAEWLGLRRINVSPRVTTSVLRAILNPWAAPLLRRLG
jgi:hypothetical protein